MLVYDLTNAASFENIEDWMDLVNTQFAGNATKPHIALVGNKRDVSHLRVVRDPCDLAQPRTRYPAYSSAPMPAGGFAAERNNCKRVISASK